MFQVVKRRQSSFRPFRLCSPLSNGRLHLVKAIVVVAPEASPPGMVQGINGMILFFQPAAEALLAQRAVAFAAQLIGNVPQDQAGVVAHSVDQVVQQLLYPSGGEMGLVRQWLWRMPWWSRTPLDCTRSTSGYLRASQLGFAPVALPARYKCPGHTVDP